MNNDGYIVLSNNEAREFAQNVCKYLKKEFFVIERTIFANREIKVKIPVNVREHMVFYIHGFGNKNVSPAEGCIELLMVNDALKRAAADKIINVLPYMPYTRQDRKDQPRVSITSSLLAKLIQTSGADRIITTDLHTGQIQGFYDIPVDNLYTGRIISKHVKNSGYRLDKLAVCAPDSGAVKRARAFAERLGGFDLIILDKRRPRDDKDRPIPNKSEVIYVIGDPTGKDVFMFDDIIDTGGTFRDGAKALKEKGALRIFAAATHGVLSSYQGTTAEEKIFPQIERLVVTDTIQQESHPKKDVASVTGLYAEVIKRTSRGESLSELFE